MAFTCNRYISTTLRSRVGVLCMVLIGTLATSIKGTAQTQEVAAQGTPDKRGTIIAIPNGDFENGVMGWTIAQGRGEVGITTEHVAGGKSALKIITDSKRNGAKIEGPMVPCRGPGVILLRGKMNAFSGEHLGLWIREYDIDGQLLPSWPNNWSEQGGLDERWGDLYQQVILDERTAALQLFFLAYPSGHERIEVYIDDLYFERVPPRIPPGPSQYKLRPVDREKLTAADIVGPDGIVYPNWTQVGVQGGIPDVPVVARLEEYGARPGTNIAGALSRACRDVGARGGGAILIGEGTFFLDTEVHIGDNGVVIRGVGRDRTRLIFRYGHADGPAGDTVSFYWPPKGGTVGPDTRVEIHDPTLTLRSLRLYRDGKLVKTRKLAGRWLFALTVTGAELLTQGGQGNALLRAEAEYENGDTTTVERMVRLSTENQPAKAGPPIRAALYFSPSNRILEPNRYLAEDGKRGDTTLVFADADGLRVGDKFYLHAPVTERFRELIQFPKDMGWVRIAFFEVRAVDGNRVTINQPLRIDYPVIDGTFARRLHPLERSGVEHLTIEHSTRLPIDSVHFAWAWNCWARNVKVVNTGRNGAYAEHSKWIEIRDCELNGAWNNDGGQAYAGFTRSTDCLMDNCVVRRYRHGPVVQFGAMGNVFRNSTFDGSDLQWHAGWSTENLFENCVVRSYRGSGSYGYGAYATGSDDMTHGPNGPRNVVYHCDFTSQRDGVALNGFNEHWLFLHNRFVVDKGAGISLTRASFDHLIRNNMFVLKDGVSPLLRLRTEDCVGIDLIGNTLYGGNGQLVVGEAALTIIQENRALPFPHETPPRPVANPPSIYEWQQRDNGHEKAAGDETKKTSVRHERIW